MFKLNPNPTFWVKVKVHTPGGVESDFEIEYRHKGREALKKFFDTAVGREEYEVMLEIINNWKGVDADFTKENLALMLDNYPALGSTLMNDYAAELMKAREGN